MVKVDGNSISITGAITSHTAKRVREFLAKNNNQRVAMFIDSEGGDIPAMLKIVHYMEMFGGTIETHSGEMVASASLTIFFCGDVRIAHTDTTFTFHRALMTVNTANEDMSFTISNLQSMVERLLEDTATMMTLAEEHCGIDKKVLLDKTKNCTDWDFGAEEAIEYGFADLLGE